MIGGHIIEVLHRVIFGEVLIGKRIDEFLVLFLPEVCQFGLVVYLDLVVLVLEQPQEVLAEDLECALGTAEVVVWGRVVAEQLYPGLEFSGEE